MSKAGIIGGLFGAIMLGVILFLSLGFDQYTCEVCIEFNGRNQCRKASGVDKETAMKTAHDNACAYLVASKTDGFLCGQTQPARISCQ